MKARFSFKVLVLILFTPLLIFSQVPVEAMSGKTIPSFSDFVATVSDGQSGVVTGVYVTGMIANKVVQQFDNVPGYVSAIEGVVTQFRMSIPYGVIGLLAHNNLAGKNFANLQQGQEVRIIYGDGSVSSYIIKDIKRYKANDPQSSVSNFTDLNTGMVYTSAQIFSIYYQSGSQVTFQTCIPQGGDLSWGRLFITAIPGVPVLAPSAFTIAPQTQLIYK
jgi:hypothetical protein